MNRNGQSIRNNGRISSISLQNVSAALESYWHFKDTEIKKSQIKSKWDHCLSLLRIYYSDRENHQKISKLSNDLLQQNYLLLSANNLITNDLQTKYNQLYKLFDGRTTKFADDETSKAEAIDYEILAAHNMDDDDIELDNRFENGIDSKAMDVFVAPRDAPKVKRALDCGAETNSMPKRFAGQAQINSGKDNLNSTHVLAKHSNLDDDLDDDIKPISIVDTTFSLDTKLKGILAAKRPMSAVRALKETNPNVNKDIMRGK